MRIIIILFQCYSFVESWTNKIIKTPNKLILSTTEYAESFMNS